MTVLLFLMLLGDVPVVDNGIVPAQGNATLTFSEELRIDEDSDEDHGIWSGPYLTFAVNNTGMIFIVDPAEDCIHMFSADGVFQKQIGRRGQGPGEFVGLTGISFFEDGSAVAHENTSGQVQLTWYNKDMNFVKKARVPRSTLNLNWTPNGKLAYADYTATPPGLNKMRKGGFFVDSEMEVLKELVHVDVMQPDPSRFGEAAFWSEFIASQLMGNARGLVNYAAVAGNDRIYTARGDRYEITVWNGKLEKQGIFRKKYTPRFNSDEDIAAVVEPIQEQLNAQLPPNIAEVITPNVIKRAVALAAFPASQLPVNGLVALGDKGLLVIHRNSNVDLEETADYFNADGVYRGSVTMDQRALGSMRYVNGKAYALLTNEDGDRALVRYRVTGF